ncbi:MAG: hypothetical protein GC185_05690 [Alphaproteobacteria bacterium]|nr:hypothetical protein [Alphaproteobacteria bacterium]
MKKFSIRLALVAAAFFCVGMAGQAFAQGYGGLIPDDEPAATGNSNSNSNANDDGYGGLIAPSQPEPTGVSQPRGYDGVIPGAVDSQPTGTRSAKTGGQNGKASTGANLSPAQYGQIAKSMDPDAARGYTPIHRTPEVTYRPGFHDRAPALSVDDLKALAALLKHGIDFGKLPAEFEKSIHMPPGTFHRLSHPQNRIDGMLPTEYAIKRMIDTTMKLVNDPSYTPEQRHRQALAAMDRLERMATGMAVTASIPKSIYDKMGAPEVYVQQETEGSQRALKRLHDAMEILSKI